MKMSPFDYHRPDTVDEAVAPLDRYCGDGKVLAGGQSLLPVLALRLTSLGHLIDIGQVRGLREFGPRRPRRPYHRTAPTADQDP